MMIDVGRSGECAYYWRISQRPKTLVVYHDLYRNNVGDKKKIEQK